MDRGHHGAASRWVKVIMTRGHHGRVILSGVIMDGSSCHGILKFYTSAKLEQIVYNMILRIFWDYFHHISTGSKPQPNQTLLHYQFRIQIFFHLPHGGFFGKPTGFTCIILPPGPIQFYMYGITCFMQLGNIQLTNIYVNFALRCRYPIDVDNKRYPIQGSYMYCCILRHVNLHLPIMEFLQYILSETTKFYPRSLLYKGY